MTKINYKSDFKLVAPKPKTDNFVFHYTTDESVCYDISYENGRAIAVDDNVILVFEDHNLPIGQLKVRKEYLVDDTDAQDDILDVVTAEKLDIYLLDCETDQFKGVVVEETFTIYRGYSAYEIAVKHGYEGTEEEWLKEHNLKYYEEDWFLGMKAARIEVGDGNKYSDITIDPMAATLTHHVGTDSTKNGTVRVSEYGINISHEGNGYGEMSLDLYAGEITFNGYRIHTDEVIKMTWPDFNRNTFYPKNGWYRINRVFGPGQSTGYDGFAYSLRSYGRLTQLFFVDDTKTILYRNLSTALGEVVDTQWYNINTHYSAGNNISISANNTISAVLPSIKTVNGESLLGEGDIEIKGGTDLQHYSETEESAKIEVTVTDETLGDLTGKIEIKRNPETLGVEINFDADSILMNGQGIATLSAVDRHIERDILNFKNTSSYIVGDFTKGQDNTTTYYTMSDDDNKNIKTNIPLSIILDGRVFNLAKTEQKVVDNNSCTVYYYDTNFIECEDYGSGNTLYNCTGRITSHVFYDTSIYRTPDDANVVIERVVMSKMNFADELDGISDLLDEIMGNYNNKLDLINGE